METSVSPSDLCDLDTLANQERSEEEDAEDYPFPLTLKTKKDSGTISPAIPATNGT
jgi:hypothetical protein